VFYSEGYTIINYRIYMSYKVSDPRFWEERNKPKRRVMAGKGQKGNKYLNRNSSEGEKQIAADAVYDLLSDALFDKLSFISFPFTQTKQIYPMTIQDGISGLTTVGSEKTYAQTKIGEAGVTLEDRDHIQFIEADVTDTERYWGIGRIPNTSEGKFLRPDRQSRVRCSFYVNCGQYIDGYLLTNVVYDSFTSLNYFNSMDIFRSYLGLRFLEGKAYIAIKEAEKEETLTEIDSVNVSGTGFSTTYRLDITSTGKSCRIFIDGIDQGTFSSDATSGFGDSVSSYLPLFIPAKMTESVADPKGGNLSVAVYVENFQFIQNNT